MDMNAFSLKGKIAWITGASYGIGFAIAQAYAAAGATIVFNDRGQEQLDKGLENYEKAGIKAYGYVCDVTDEEAVQATVKKIEEEVGTIDILVNNAGISTPTAPNEWLTKQDFMKILDVNLLGVIDVTLSVLPLVRKARGRVVNVSSVTGRLALLGGGYSMSKYGVEAFSDSLR